MNKKQQSNVGVDQIEIPAIRLTSEETRAIMECMTRGNYSSYHGNSMEALGIMEREKSRSDKEAKLSVEWQKVQICAGKRDSFGVSRALSAIQEINRGKDNRPFVLTSLGKQVARKVTVRMNGQFAK